MILRPDRIFDVNHLTLLLTHRIDQIAAQEGDDGPTQKIQETILRATRLGTKYELQVSQAERQLNQVLRLHPHLVQQLTTLTDIDLGVRKLRNEPESAHSRYMERFLYGEVDNAGRYVPQHAAQEESQISSGSEVVMLPKNFASLLNEMEAAMGDFRDTLSKCWVGASKNTRTGDAKEDL